MDLSNEESVVSLERVTKAFPNAQGVAEPALGEVTFHEEKGELYCLLGPSGCGKTTILNLVAGFLTPTSGRVLVNREEVTGPGPDRAVVFQHYALLPWFTVRRNVELGLNIQSLSRDEIKVRADTYLRMVGLSAAEHKYPHQLSGGMQQRASMARALALEPVILLMDEPFGGLDAYTRMDMQAELTRIWEETAKTILFVTHSVDEAIYLGTHVLIMSGHPGTLLEEIKIDLPRPRDRTSAGFNEIKRHVFEQLGGVESGTAEPSAE